MREVPDGRTVVVDLDGGERSAGRRRRRRRRDGGRGAGARAGEVRYHLVLAGGRLRVHPGDAPAADVTLVQSRDVAAALSRGELNAQQALEAGRLKLRGDVGHLAREGKALVALEDVFAAVRDATSY
jgi:hypothetical protein